MDWDKIASLLHIAEKAGGHPQLANIRNAALTELAKHNAEAGKPPMVMRSAPQTTVPVVPEAETGLVRRKLGEEDNG